jgi:hypothetical protein
MSTPAIHVGGEIFLVICKDRHVDVMVSVHATRQSADGAIEAFMASYGERIDPPYQWAERGYGRAQGWLRYVGADNDEGPCAYIERGTLQGDI